MNWRGTVALLLLAGLLRAQVSYQRILSAEKEPANWLTYSGNYNGQRYSPLDGIRVENAAGLRAAWVFQMDLNHKLETSPLVVDGVMILTEPPSNVTALDAATGRPYWRYRRPTPKDIRACCGQVNRGAAVLGDLVFVGTVDAHLVALDMATGRVRWDVEVAPYKQGYTISAAPLALKDRVIIGVAGGEFGIRGFLDAYEAATGRRLWRHYTVPGPGEAGHQTWKGDSWKTGGAATYVTGSFDPQRNTLYWTTGNPAPDFNDEARQGDNLYSNSLLAIDPDTGKRKWHYQFTPGDVFDWGANHVPVLVDRMVNGKPRKLVVIANRNAYYYVLDRESGEFLTARPYARQSWCQGMDAQGRPIKIAGLKPSLEGTLVYPGVEGASNWPSPAYSPVTGLVYVPTREEGSVVIRGEGYLQPGAVFTGGAWRKVPEKERYGAIRALKVESGELSWEFRLQSPAWTGVLTTAGGLVFAGAEEGDFFALEAASGKLLWRFQTGGRIIANPISYAAGGRQFVAIASGQAIFAFHLDR